jgi:hypothetical protein
VTADPRLARLRDLDAEATPGPWERKFARVLARGDGGWRIGVHQAEHTNTGRAVADADLIAVMRNAWPAMIEVVALALAVHVPNEDYQQPICRGCARLGRWPCGHYLAAMAVLDTLGEPS